jgi:hypothetical protein
MALNLLCANNICNNFHVIVSPYFIFLSPRFSTILTNVRSLTLKDFLFDRLKSVGPEVSAASVVMIDVQFIFS